MAKFRRSTLLLGSGIILFATTTILTTAVLSLKPSLLAGMALRRPPKTATVCKTIATDPNPPLNVRSSPVSAPDNIIGKLKNGTVLTIVDENQGWLRITSPLDGWVYQELTVTTCIPKTAETASSVPATPDQTPDPTLLAQATEHYQAGNLNAAIAVANLVPPSSPDYQMAQAAVIQWPKEWKIAEAEFYVAQKAVRDRRWQDVLAKVKTFPANRFWRAKLAPLAQEAMQQQNATAQTPSHD